jgi:membrane peptidoglycan carboxypeptidase
VIGRYPTSCGDASLNRFIRLRESQAKKDGKKYLVRRAWTSLEKIPELFKKAVLVSEDAEKSLLRKIKEALIAKRLERHLSKNRIFSLYLNSIEFGPGVFGVQAASRHWFGQDVGDLSLEEIVRLTAIIPRPLTADPRTNSSWMKFKGPWIARTLKAVQAIDETDYGALVRAFE